MIEIIPLIQDYGLIGVLIVTALSYSVVPFPSEAAIIVASSFLSPYSVILFALIGSTIGAVSSYYLGYFGLKRVYGKDGASKVEKKAKKIFEKYGGPSVFLFGWLPIIGDPLIIVAGSLEMNFIKFFIYSTTSRLIYFILTVLAGFGIESLFGINFV